MQTVAHNLLAQFTDRQLNITNKNKEKSTEKLSSGYRINRAADDTAGLQISEKMRWQVRGLNKASNNIQDGISLLLVADGALNETHEVLQRMRELAVQAANDTNTEADRAAIQNEIDLLTEEVDRIANDTSFNEEIYPLLNNIQIDNGDISSEWGKITYEWNGQIYNIKIQQMTHVFTATRNPTQIINGKLYNQGDKVIMTGLAISDDNPNTKDIFLYNYGGFTFGTMSETNSVNSYSESSDLTLTDLFVDTNGHLCYRQIDGRVYHFAYNNNNGGKEGDAVLTGDQLASELDKPHSYLVRFKVEQRVNNEIEKPEKLWIQMGAKSNQGMFVSLVDATAKGVGITDPALDVTSYDNASATISRIDNAINKVSSYRSNFGAQQNRLEHAMTVDDNTSENTQAAESRLRDADMAEEMVNYARHSILQQAGQSMLAQANQIPNGIIQLLQ